MTIEIKPKFISEIEDDPAADAAGAVTPSRWNEGSALEMATARLIGRVTSGQGSAEEIQVVAGLLLDAEGLGIDKASAAQWAQRTANKVLTADGLASAFEAVTLTDASTVALDWTAGFRRRLTMAGNRTLGNPTNVVSGSTIVLEIYGNNATARSLSFGSNYRPALPAETLTSSKGLILSLYAESTTRIIPTWKVVT